MSNRVGFIVTQGLKFYFTEPVKKDDYGKRIFLEVDNHAITVARLRWEENKDRYVRWFVRVEIYGYNLLEPTSKFDEDNSLPPWIGIWQDEILDRGVKLASRLGPIYDEFRVKFITSHNTDQIYDEFIKRLKDFSGFVPPDYVPE